MAPAIKLEIEVPVLEDDGHGQQQVGLRIIEKIVPDHEDWTFARVRNNLLPQYNDWGLFISQPNQDDIYLSMED